MVMRRCASLAKRCITSMLAVRARGPQTQYTDDDALLAASRVVFDALYAGLRGRNGNNQ